jgi:hypothetical protein
MLIMKINEDWLIETPEGFVEFEGIQTISGCENWFHITLENDMYIKCSTTHIFVIDEVELRALDLIEGMVLQTKDGFKKIVKIEPYKNDDLLFDIVGVNNESSCYYSNGIISHNCKFLGSSNTLIDGEVLERLETMDAIDTKYTGSLLIYEHPIPNAMYILGVDSAEGTGLDYSVIQVLKINTEFDIDQVAVYRNNTIDPHKFQEVCIGISQYYNEGYMMIENNNVGSIVAEGIWYDYEYEKILNCDAKGIGIRSTRKSKLAANMLVKKYIQNGWLSISDKNTVYELSLYVEVSPNVFKAGKHEHDDCVTSLIWGIYFLSTIYFDGKSNDVKVIDERFKIGPASDMSMPTPVINDGISDNSNISYNSDYNLDGDSYYDDPHEDISYGDWG